MISLRKSLDQIQECEIRFQAGLNGYVAAITSMEAHTVPIHKDLDYSHRLKLRHLRRRVREGPHPEAIQQCQQALDRLLEDYCRKASDILEQKDGEVKRIIQTLAEATAVLTAHNEAHNNRLGRFAEQLEACSRINDLAEIRRRLVEEVGGLKSYVEAIRRDNQGSVEKLRREIEEFQRRLEKAETLAATDPLTGVANRMEGERNLEEMIREGMRFSILLIDLDAFKTVNDRYGHHAGDLVLKAFAKRLASSVRPQDTVCRWGGDEFLLILAGCGLQQAMARVKEIAERCGGEYGIAFEGRRLDVNVRVSSGAAEHRPGESSMELFRRADKFLYRAKESTVELTFEKEPSL